MKILVTGGAGFIGRWVVARLLRDQHQVWVLDNLTNGRTANLAEFIPYSQAFYFQKGDINNPGALDALFQNNFDLCFHLAASINVQESIDDPRTTFTNDTAGTFQVLEKCREYRVKMVFMSTCMVYDAADARGITEEHPTRPSSPYAGSKIAAENLVLSYYYAYTLPVVIIRPFNTYGPFQKAGGEGGVVSIFIRNKLNGGDLSIFGDGAQTRDLLYVEDCADFVVAAGYSPAAEGQIFNAGLGQDISINELAALIMKDPARIVHLPHIHPQSEIRKLLCDYGKARKILHWEPKVSLEEGLGKTEEWMRKEGLSGWNDLRI